MHRRGDDADARVGRAGRPAPGALSAAGFGWLAAIALVSTVAAVSLFFAGLRRVGPTTASIVSTAEPVTTVVLAFLVFGESLSGCSSPAARSWSAPCSCSACRARRRAALATA